MHKYTLNLNIVPYNPTNCSIYGRFVILDQTQVKILACAPPSSLPVLTVCVRSLKCMDRCTPDRRD